MDSSGTRVWSRSGSVGLLQHRCWYIAAGRGWTVRGTVGRRHGAVYTARCRRIDVRQRSSLRRRPRRAHAETERARPNLGPNSARKSTESDPRNKSESVSESGSEFGSESWSESESELRSQVRVRSQKQLQVCVRIRVRIWVRILVRI